MSSSFKPRHVSSDVISRWPQLALALWRKSFSQQAALLLAAALASRCLPAWSPVIGFLIAPSLFVVAFVAVQMADEGNASWVGLTRTAWRGALRTGTITVQFGIFFAAIMAALYSIASVIAPSPTVSGIIPGAGLAIAQPASIYTSGPLSDSLVSEFVYFCASWMGEIVAMVFLGLFIVAIYQAVLGIILHALHEMDAGLSRAYGWKAWEINSESIKIALKQAPAKFFLYLAAGIATIICSFQTVYLSPAGLLLATYVPCLTYVAFRSIFLGKHKNVEVRSTATARTSWSMALAGRVETDSVAFSCAK